MFYFILDNFRKNNISFFYKEAMSSLLYHAAPFSENASKEKKPPRMKSTYENIRKEYKEPRSEMNEPTSMDEDLANNIDKTEKMNSIIQKMNSRFQTNQAGSNLHDFNPNSNNGHRIPKLSSLQSSPEFPQPTTLNVPINRENFMDATLLDKQRAEGSSFVESYTATPYYKGLGQKQYTPMNSNPVDVNRFESSAQLMEKLNYMIHLLEEQQKEPTQNIMEEFILYGLLGVFMIYLADSFSRAGKYIR